MSEAFYEALKEVEEANKKRSKKTKDENKFIPVTLYGKKANFSTETETIVIKESSTIKAITSGKPGDEITIEQKHKPAFAALVNPILVIAMNKPMALPANRTHALERRIQIINFPNRFSKNPKNGELQSDYNLENTEHTKPIVNGLLLLVLGAIKSMIHRGSIWQEGAVENLRAAILKGSHLERFMYDCLEEDIEAKTESSKIWESYKSFCLEEGLAQEYPNKSGEAKILWHDEKYDKACKSADSLTKKLIQHFKKKIKPDFIQLENGKKARAISGIKLKVRQDDVLDIKENDEKSASILGCTPERESIAIFPKINPKDKSKEHSINNTNGKKDGINAYSRINQIPPDLSTNTPQNRDKQFLDIPNYHLIQNTDTKSNGNFLEDTNNDFNWDEEEEVSDPYNKWKD